MILKVLLVLILLMILCVLLNLSTIKRLYHVIHLFDKEVITDNFQNMEESFDVTLMKASPQAMVLPQKNNVKLPVDFKYKGKTFNLEEYLDKTLTEGLLIIQNDTILYERYELGLEKDETHISWSMSKSFVATLVGVMVEQGKIDLEAYVQNYCPEFEGTGYENVTIKNLLNMSSGVRFTEDYGDFNSDINKFGRAFAKGSSVLEFAKGLVNERTPGTYNKYVSIDTQVLGFVIAKVAGKSITELMQKYIWDPAGMEHDAAWIVDDTGFEFVLGGLNATLRDYAKLGLLYLHNGTLNNNKIVSPQWVHDATTPDEPHLMPNQTELSNSHFGYAYQWWTPQFPKNDFFAVGIYDQFVYVNREKNLVIAKLSSDYNFKTDGPRIKDQHIVMMQELASHF